MKWKKERFRIVAELSFAQKLTTVSTVPTYGVEYSMICVCAIGGANRIRHFIQTQPVVFNLNAMQNVLM